MREVQGPSISRQDARFRYSTCATNYRESGLVRCPKWVIRDHGMAPLPGRVFINGLVNGEDAPKD